LSLLSLGDHPERVIPDEHVLETTKRTLTPYKYAALANFRERLFHDVE
jgi:hypothetical protein